MALHYDVGMHELGEQGKVLNARIFTPNSLLRELISNYHLISGENLFTADNKWYILPDNCSHLIFYLLGSGNTITPKWSLIGPRSKHKIINRRDRLFTFICSFKPGGLRPFVEVPLNELRDQSLDASTLLKNYQHYIFEQLTLDALHGDYDNFIKRFESFLLKVVDQNIQLKVHHAVSAYYHQFAQQQNSTSLPRIAHHLGYSERQLRNIFQNHIGHSPKRVEQIQRFTHSLQNYQHEKSWTQLACASGYYDQSHMISDYHKLVGSSPEKLLK